MIYLNSVKAISNKISVLFIDSAVQNIAQLLLNVKPNVYTHVLNPHEDGIAQITEVLCDRYRDQSIESVSIISHGVPGCLSLGAIEFGLHTINSYIRWISMWETQSINLYSCNVAAGDAGEEFVSLLHRITGAEISASSTPVGHKSLGGNWVLDVSTQDTVRTVWGNQDALAQYPYILDPITLQTSFEGLFDYAVTGGSFRTEPNSGNTAAVGSSASGALTIPPGTTVKAAYLYWAGSGNAADSAVSLDGTTVNASRVFDADFDSTEGYFSGFADVTSAVTAKGSGTYTLTDLSVNTGSPHSDFSTVMATWGMIVVYDDPSATVASQINIYDGFELFYTGTGYTNNRTFTLNDLNIPTGATAKLTSLVWEGDENISGSEQLTANGVAFSSPSGSSHDSVSNEAGVGAGGPAYGADIDSFDITSALTPGSTSVDVGVSTGGDQVHVSAFVVKVDTLLPATVDLNGAPAGQNYATTFTEGADPVAIVDAAVDIVDIDSTTLESATIVLTNAKTDDILTVGSLPTDIGFSVDTSVSGKVTVSLSGTATLEDYETALQAITFSNSSSEPNTTNRNINITVNDGDSPSQAVSTTVSVIEVLESVPVLTAPSDPVGALEDIDASAQDLNVISGNFSVFDANVGDTLTPTVVSTTVELNGVTFTLPAGATDLIAAGAFNLTGNTSNGSNVDIGYSYDPGAVNLDFLEAGDSLTLAYEVKVNDGSADSNTEIVTITLTGTNDAPILSDTSDPAPVTEMLGTSDQDLDAIAGTFTVSDFDNNSTFTSEVVGSPVVERNGMAFTLPTEAEDLIANGVFNLNDDVPGNVVNYTYDPGTVNLDFLSAGDNLTLTYTVKVNDGIDDSVTQDVTITLAGTNDAPVANGDARTTDEETPITLSIVPNASDVDGIINGNAFALVDDVTEGTLVFNPNGSYTFNPDSDFQDLAVGESRQVFFTYTAEDDDGATSKPATITITVTGTNDGPVLVDTTDPAPVVEALDASAQDLDAIAGTFVVNDADNGDTLTPTVVGSPVVLLDGVAYSLPTEAAALTAPTAFTLIGNTTNGGSTSVGYSYDPSAANLDFLPAGQDLTLTYTVQVNDGTDDSETQDVTITISGTNDAPVVSADARAIDEDSVLNSAVPMPTDVDGTIAGNSYVLSTPVSAGELTFNNDGTYSFTPGADFQDLKAGESRTAIFSYTVEDNSGATSAPETVTITVTGNNDTLTLSDTTDPAPVNELVDASVQDLDAIAGSFEVTDLDSGDTLTSTLVGSPTVTLNGGTFSLPTDAADLIAASAFTVSDTTSNGATTSVDYTYDPGVVDLDFLQDGDALRLTYVVEVDDGSGNPMSQDVVITLNGTNDAPVLSDTTDPAAVVEATDASAQDLSVIAGSFLLEDTDIGDTLTPSVVGSPTVELDGAAFTLPTGAESLIDSGAFSLIGTIANGSTTPIEYRYDPEAASLDFLSEGQQLTVTYQVKVNDGLLDSEIQDVTITITGTNDIPVVSGSNETTDEDTVLFESVPTATDIDGTIAPNGFSLVDNVSTGTLVFNDDGTYSFTPGAEFQDLKPDETREVTFTYTATDNDGGVSEPATITITVTGDNDGPVLLDTLDPAPIDELVDASAQEIAVTGTFDVTDADIGDTLAASVVGDPVVSINGTPQPLPAGAQGLVAAGAFTLTDGLSNGGTTSIDYSYDPDPVDLDFLSVGDSLTITYEVKVNDGTSDSATQNVTITIEGTNDVPVAFDDTQTTDEETPILLGIVPNATDVDGIIDGNAFALITDVTEGTLTFNNNGGYSFDPGADFQDLAAGESRDVSFTYTATDNDGAVSKPATITITVTGNNDGPILSDTSDSSAIAELLDASAQDLSPIAGSFAVEDADIGNTIEPSLVNGPVVALDGAAFTLPTTAEALVAANAFSLTGATSDGGSVDIDYSYDPGAADLDFLSVGEQLTLTYTVQVSDGIEDSATQDVTVTIVGTNDSPLVTADTQTIDEDGVLDSNVPAATDVDGSIPADGYALVDDVSAGSLTFFDNGGYVFDPGADFQDLKPGETRDVTFTYTATDNDGGVSEPATVTITVTGSNDGPVLSDTTDPATVIELVDASVQDLEAIAGTFTVNDSDIGETLTATVVGEPAVELDGTAFTLPAGAAALIDSAAFALAGNTSNGGDVDINYNYDPTAVDLDFLAEGENLTLIYTVQVSDGTSDSVTQDVTITITGTNDIPVVTADAQTTDEDTLFNASVPTATDVDGTVNPTG
ncbi:MAG: VCBS domain-containing protein, partial [Cyanobacteria bacterium J06650_10]